MRIHSIASIALDGYVIGLTNLKKEEIKLKKKSKTHKINIRQSQTHK